MGKQILRVLMKIKNLEIKDLNLSSNDLSAVSAATLAGAIIRLEICGLSSCVLTSHQLYAIFTFIREARTLKLNDLYLSDNDLSEVSSDLLAGAVVRLEIVDFCSTLLSEDQLCCIFSLVAENKSGRLKEIRLFFQTVNISV